MTIVCRLMLLTVHQFYVELNYALKELDISHPSLFSPNFTQLRLSPIKNYYIRQLISEVSLICSNLHIDKRWGNMTSSIDIPEYTTFQSQSFFLIAKNTPKSQPLVKNPQFCEFQPETSQINWTHIESLGAEISGLQATYKSPKQTSEVVPNSLGRVVYDSIRN